MIFNNLVLAIKHIIKSSKEKNMLKEICDIMYIVYASKTGFTKKYADMLASKTGFKAIPVKEISKIDKDEEIIFFGWLKVGKIQGLNKLKRYNIKAVCATGAARTAEPSTEVIIIRNKIEDVPLFYLRGGCLPLKKLKGMDKIMMSLFVKTLKKRKDNDKETEESIYNIEHGFNGVKEENLKPVLDWLESRSL